MSTERFELVIIDDSVRFAFHVWRYLGRSIGIGVGSDVLTEDGPRTPHDQKLRNLFETETGPRELLTSDGRVAVWWVPGDTTVIARLSELLNGDLKNKMPFFVVDMRGQPASTTEDERERSAGEGLGREAVTWIIQERFPGKPDEAERAIMVVSSYETGSLDVEGVNSPLRIWPKSPDTLERLWRRVSIKPNSRTLTLGRPCLHILVTGAGFEIRDDQTGCFGLPATAELLLEMGDPFGKSDRLLQRRPKGEKGLPAFDTSRGGAFVQNFNIIAQRGDLDAWWSFLLEYELEELVPRLAGIEERIPSKMLASIREQDLREAFRRVILRYDWGLLNQSLDAVGLDWSSWLTTNYTRFADRAIELVQADWDRSQPNETRGVVPKKWRVVSTSIEALMLSRETLHNPSQPNQEAKQSRHEYRYLFKLHGDIAHLHTMATAGYDKELYGPLSVPVDSLHQVYATAEGYLRHQSNMLGEAHLVWHIVGHGLQDWLLLRLISEVCKSRPDGLVEFLVVNKNPEAAKINLSRFLERRLPALQNRIKSLEQTATDYLSRLSHVSGLPESDGGMEDWLRDLGFV